MLAQDALDAISARLETFEAGTNQTVSAEMEVAIGALQAFINDADLEWGEVGDCQDRIYNDPDISKAIVNGLTSDEFTEEATRRGFGRHFGNPQCIWCLQAQ